MTQSLFAETREEHRADLALISQQKATNVRFEDGHCHLSLNVTENSSSVMDSSCNPLYW